MGVTALAMGIPAGVKIHLAVFGVNPASTGELAAQFLRDEIHTLRNAEVMDIDEVAYRQGIVSPRLFGYLQIPYQINLNGVFYVGQAAARRMEKGVIVNMASTNGLLGYPHYANYNASKAGVIELTRSMALELAPQVRVVAVCPG